MAADNTITLFGNIVFDPEVSETNRPSRFKVASYCSGSGDNRKTAFISVKSFDGDMVATLSKGQRVGVTGRLDPWSRQDSKDQIMDVLADDGGIVLVDRNNQPIEAAVPAPAEAPVESF